MNAVTMVEAGIVGTILWGATAVQGGVAASQGSGRPNIVLFLVDDLGWQDCSVPMWDRSTPFNQRYHTPNLEALAERGLVFSDAYASSPVCTPTRVGIMTGQSPARTGITYWTLNAGKDTSRQHPTIQPPAWNLDGLQPGTPTLPGLLRDAGYQTFQVGKAHFGAHGTDGSHPTNLGFDQTVAGHGSGGPASYYGTQSFSLDGRRGTSNGPSVWDVPDLDDYHDQEIYLTEALALEASKLIERTIQDQDPFFMWFSPYAVHAPIMANTKYLDRYTEEHETEAAYATMIETVDAALGQLISTIDRLGQRENTIIIFWSDNGGLSAHARGGEPHSHNAPLRSGKGSAYEGGVRVPGVIAWPGVTDRPGRTNQPAVAHDLMPTILAMAGLQAPEGDLDGMDLTPLVRTGVGTPDRVIGWHMPHQWGAPGPGIEPFTAVRMGNLKLIYFHADRRLELYDLVEDIAERHNLAQSDPDRLAVMAGVMDRWIARTGADLSIDKATGLAIEGPVEALKRSLDEPVQISPVP